MLATNGQVNQVHIMYNGTSHDLTFDDLDIGELSTDDDIRGAAATWLDTPRNKLDGFVVDKTVEGQITIRPMALFGV